jgi:putative NADPH-quinone reductase
MRKILVIEGHPDGSPERLNHALADAYADAAQEAGNEVRRVRVAELDFPLLRTLDDFEHGTPVAAIASVQDDVTWADHYVLVFPLWIGNVPAMLKAFMEQTFRPSVTMEAGRRPKRLLRGKTARIVVTMGMPAFIFRTSFGSHAVKALERILEFGGIRPVRSTIIGGVETVCSSRARKLFAQMAFDVQEDTAPRPRFGRRILGALLRVGAAAGTVYAANTIAAWAQYGSVSHDAREDDFLDRVMPDYEVRVRHGISVNAGADDAFQAICALDFRHLPPIVSTLFKARELLFHRADGEAQMPDGLIDQLASFGWTVMPESSARELIFVTVTQPWTAVPVFRSIPAHEFTQFDEPGYTKIAMTMRTDAIGDDAAHVQTETRVKATDPVSRARFRRYWALVSPGIALIRMALLQHIKHQAESKDGSALAMRTESPGSPTSLLFQ